MSRVTVWKPRRPRTSSAASYEPEDLNADVNSLSDFPTLGGPQPRQQQSASGGWNSSAIRQQQPSQPAQQHVAAPHPQPQRAPSATPLDQFDGQSAQSAAAEHSATGENIFLNLISSHASNYLV